MYRSSAPSPRAALTGQRGSARLRAADEKRLASPRAVRQCDRYYNWRRGRDSNPRWRFRPPYSLSRGAPSAARPPLHALLKLPGGRSWRRVRDSNPRTSCPVYGFQDRRLRPLGQPSGQPPGAERLATLQLHRPACRTAKTSIRSARDDGQRGVSVQDLCLACVQRCGGSRSPGREGNPRDEDSRFTGRLLPG